MNDPAARPTPPVKTRELLHPLMDSAVWNDFPFRADDIVIATYAKAGTTWMQQIVAELVLAGQQVDVHAVSPWLDARSQAGAEKVALLEAQRHRRFIKTHLPVDALVMSPQARYLYVARDGRDVVWSMHNHHAQMKDEAYAQINARLGAGEERFPHHAGMDHLTYFRRWMDRDGHPWWPFWENVRTWWAVRDHPNVLLVHFGDLKRDLAGEIGRIARFLDVPLDAAGRERTARHCSLAYMKENAQRFSPGGGARFKDGARGFINEGTNGRWQGVLGPDDIARYEVRACAELGPECAAWLASGSRSSGGGASGP